MGHQNNFLHVAYAACHLELYICTKFCKNRSCALGTIIILVFPGGGGFFEGAGAPKIIFGICTKFRENDQVV